LKLARKNIFTGAQFLLLLFVKNSHNIFLCCYYSTYSKTEDSEHIGVCHRQQYVRKPSIAQNYNDFMGGVNTCDAILYSYLDKRRMGKYWKNMCFNVFFKNCSK